MTNFASRQPAISLVVMLFAATTSLADDFAPPPWRGDQDGGTTVQEWDFRSSDSVRNINDPLPPDGTTITPQRWGPGDAGDPPIAWEDGGWGWINNGNGDGRIISLGDRGVVHLMIPNMLDNNPVKYLRIQITFTDGLRLGDVPSVRLVSSAFGDGERVGPAHLPAAGQRWEDWVMSPNPHLEYIDIDVPQAVSIDQLVVDTICTVPEPRSIALLGNIAGGLMLLPRRRKSVSRNRV